MLRIEKQPDGIADICPGLPCVQLFVPPLLRFPDTKTTSTAAYAAVAPNISARRALLNSDIATAKSAMKTAMSTNRIRSLVTKYSPTIAASRSSVAPMILTSMMTLVTVWCW